MNCYSVLKPLSSLQRAMLPVVDELARNRGPEADAPASAAEAGRSLAATPGGRGGVLRIGSPGRTLPAMRRYVLLGLAFALACLAAGLVALQWIESPTVLRVAVGPAAGEDARLIAGLRDSFQRERQPIRL